MSCRFCGCDTHGEIVVESYDKVQTRPTRQPDQDGQVAKEDPRGCPEDPSCTQKKIYGPVGNYVAPRLDSENYGQIVIDAYDKVNRVRTFETGATRDTDEGKLDYEGFLAPAVLERYAQYMHKHRRQSDGSLRASDNWQKGMPQTQYLKSLIRHVLEFWKWNRGKYPSLPDGQEIACAIMFNIMGWLYENLRHE